MIQIETFRVGLHCAALTVKDDRTVQIAFGWTRGQAARRLFKQLDAELVD